MIWLVPAAAVAALGAAAHPVTVDEAWSLVVARRLRRGDRLYADVFYGAAPLAIWVLAAVFRLAPPQGVVVRAMTVAYFMASAAAVVRLADGGTTEMAAVGALASFGAFHLHPHNHYGALTTTATLWAAVAVLADQVVAAGLLAAAAVLGKYSVGIVTTAGMAAAASVIGSPVDGLMLAGVAVAPLGLLAASRPRTARAFVRRAVLNKGAYLAAGRQRPLAWLRARPRSRPEYVVYVGVIALAMTVVVVSPPIAAVRAVVSGSDESIVASVIAVAGLAIVSPRFDGAHAVAASQLACPALVLAVAPYRPSVWLALIIWLIAIIGVTGRAVLTRRQRVRRNLPALRGLPVRPLAGNVWPDQTGRLPREVFVLRLDAALVYACGGVSNPTPFDYPSITTFGVEGQNDVIEAFERGLPVCAGWTPEPGPLAPTVLLERFGGVAGDDTPLGRVVRVEID